MYVVEPMKRITAVKRVSARSSAQRTQVRLTREAGDREQYKRHVPVHSVVRAFVGRLARRGAVSGKGQSIVAVLDKEAVRTL